MSAFIKAILDDNGAEEDQKIPIHEGNNATFDKVIASILRLLNESVTCH